MEASLLWQKKIKTHTLRYTCTHTPTYTCTHTHMHARTPPPPPPHTHTHTTIVHIILKCWLHVCSVHHDILPDHHIGTVRNRILHQHGVPVWLWSRHQFLQVHMAMYCTTHGFYINRAGLMNTVINYASGKPSIPLRGYSCMHDLMLQQPCYIATMMHSMLSATTAIVYGHLCLIVTGNPSGFPSLPLQTDTKWISVTSWKVSVAWKTTKQSLFGLILLLY